MKPILLLAGWVMSSDADPSSGSSSPVVHPNWGVVVHGGSVVEIAPNETLLETFPDAERMDCRKLALCPGFVNAHMHAYGLLAHGIPAASAEPGFDSFLTSFWWPKVEDLLDEPMILAAAELACLIMIRSGYTCFCDVLEAPFAPPGILSRLAAVVERSGLRAVLSIEASERAGADRGLALLEENARFTSEARSGSPIRGMQCIHTSFTCSERFVRRAKTAAEAAGSDIHLHLSESDYEPSVSIARSGVRPVHWYDHLGFWDRSVLASQVVSVDGGELDVLARHNVRTAHMPLSNCEVGGGIAPVPGMLDRGLTPGLGTDGYINDPFEVMRAAFLIHKASQRDTTVIPAATVWRMATTWSAKAIGMTELGSLCVGAPADVIGVSASGDTPLIAETFLDQILLYRSAPDVRLSMVSGRVLMRDGIVKTLDCDAVHARAAQESLRLWSQGGAL